MGINEKLVDQPRDRLRSDISGISGVGVDRADARLSESSEISDLEDKIGLS